MSERRQSLRFDKVFTVYLTTQQGMTRGIARNISSTGLFVETRDALPLGGQIKVTFTGDDGTEMTALCEVRYQVALNYGHAQGADGEEAVATTVAAGTRGAGLRIIAYETRENHPMLLVDRERVLH
ncbi:MAG: PilZ domain-containing protein [Myxococcaceae bacterium]|nr:PilZ domain-containing protein [Myxococcaceae bacterium]MDX2009523.1 PilZ domain-containing protein [Myxococcaceae bacterium]